MTSILFIEDDDASAVLVQHILMGQGYDFFRASTGFEGLNLVQQIQPDLILLDLHLPDLDGKVVANRLRSLHIPTIAITSDTSTETERLARAFGCRDFIPKPISNAHEFVLRVEKALHSRV